MHQLAAKKERLGSLPTFSTRSTISSRGTPRNHAPEFAVVDATLLQKSSNEGMRCDKEKGKGCSNPWESYPLWEGMADAEQKLMPKLCSGEYAPA